MYRDIPSINKHIKRRQQQRNRTIHLQHLKKMKSIEVTDDPVNHYPLINKKRQLDQQRKYTEIQRQNRILLQKITGIFTKKQSYSTTNEKNNNFHKSLNVSLRKKNFQCIQLQNAKMVKRLQQKKSQYEVQKMRKAWNKQKQVIKNLTNFPITIFKQKRKPPPYFMNYQMKYPVNNNENPIYEVKKTKMIDSYLFDISVRLDKMKLEIIAENKFDNQIKQIQISRSEALEYLRNECNNSLENIFNKLKYDGQILYLISENIQNQNEQLNQKSYTQANENHRSYEQFQTSYNVQQYTQQQKQKEEANP